MTALVPFLAFSVSSFPVDIALVFSDLLIDSWASSISSLEAITFVADIPKKDNALPIADVSAFSRNENLLISL